MPRQNFRLTDEQKSFMKFMFLYQNKSAEDIRLHDSMKKPDGSFHRSSTINLWLDRLNQVGNMDTLKRSGRPPKLNKDEQSTVVDFVRANPKLRYPEIKRQLKLNIHPRTINRYANKSGIRTYRAIKRPQIKKEHRIKRLRLAKGLLKKPDLINQIIFSDEKKFMCSSEKKVEYVNRTVGTAFNPNNIRVNATGSSQADTNIYGYIGPFGKGV